MLVSLMYVCLSVYHTIKCGRIVIKLYTLYGHNNTDIVKKYHRNRDNVSHKICGKLIIVDNSGTSWRVFDIMTNFFDFLNHDELFDVMTCF